jgi:ligand-binding sensor domain-containing protein
MCPYCRLPSQSALSQASFRRVVPGRFRPRRAVKLFSLCLWLLSCAQTFCATWRSDPEYLIESWETQQGLPDNSATAIVQGPDGYLWIGTFNGLVQFDGVKFIVYDPSNVPQLPSAGVVNLHYETSGRLWVSTLKGLAVRQAGRWMAYSREKGWTGDYARTFSENAGVVCITSFDGKVFRAEDGQLRELFAAPG